MGSELYCCSVLHLPTLNWIFFDSRSNRMSPNLFRCCSEFANSGWLTTRLNSDEMIFKFNFIHNVALPKARFWTINGFVRCFLYFSYGIIIRIRVRIVAVFSSSSLLTLFTDRSPTRAHLSHRTHQNQLESNSVRFSDSWPPPYLHNVHTFYFSLFIVCSISIRLL